MRKITLILIPFFLCIACDLSQKTGSENKTSFEPIVEKDPDKNYSLFNEELPEKEFTPEVREQFEQKLKVARENYDQYPDSLEVIIWYGRRLAYLGKYRQAINVYSEGIKKYPNSYRLRRHRGHRYITTRQLSQAIEDFEMAAFYSLNYDDQVEPDGLPNRLNKPLSTNKFNIWYHYGLAHYLSGRYDKALSAYKKCMEYSKNNDLKVATSYWLYLTYQKLGNKELADQTLEAMDTNIKLVENEAYLQLLQLYKGETSIKKLTQLALPEGESVDPTVGYGVGIWYQQKQQLEKANEIFLSILDSKAWDAFGYIASEAELTATFPVPTS